MVCSNKEAQKRLAQTHSRNGPWTHECCFEVVVVDFGNGMLIIIIILLFLLCDFVLLYGFLFCFCFPFFFFLRFFFGSSLNVHAG